ncbi:MAG: amidohydrolase family protein, partial [Phycisphaerales bacterium]
LTVRAAKLYMDGAMGSRGAWLLEPYADRPTGSDGQPWTGLAVADPAFIEAVARHGLEKGYQVCTHAIGDRANREVLGAYARAISGRYAGTDENEASRNHRFRIEHAQLVSLDDVHRFGQWAIIASMQPTHCTSDMRWVEARVGAKRAEGAYAWVSLLSAGAVVAGGSDFPVESHNPFLGIYAAVTRQTPEGQPEGGWRPTQKMLRMDGVYAFTRSAAYAAFEEKDRGTLEAGKLADFVVIDRDIEKCEPKEILGTRVLRTVIGGETVYEAGEE